MLLHEKSRDAGNRPVPDEHAAIVDALQAQGPGGCAGRDAGPPERVIDYLLFATEERAVAEARRSVASTRQRYGGSVRV